MQSSLVKHPPARSHFRILDRNRFRSNVVSVLESVASTRAPRGRMKGEACTAGRERRWLALALVALSLAGSAGMALGQEVEQIQAPRSMVRGGAAEASTLDHLVWCLDSGWDYAFIDITGDEHADILRVVHAEAAGEAWWHAAGRARTRAALRARLVVEVALGLAFRSEAEDPDPRYLAWGQPQVVDVRLVETPPLGGVGAGSRCAVATVEVEMLDLPLEVRRMSDDP